MYSLLPALTLLIWLLRHSATSPVLQNSTDLALSLPAVVNRAPPDPWHSTFHVFEGGGAITIQHQRDPVLPARRLLPFLRDCRVAYRNAHEPEGYFRHDSSNHLELWSVEGRFNSAQFYEMYGAIYRWARFFNGGWRGADIDCEFFGGRIQVAGRIWGAIESEIAEGTGMDREVI